MRHDRRVLLKCCVNGSRSRHDHPRGPTTPAELAADAERVVAAGAGAIHVHPRDGDGNETLEAVHVAAAVSAIRAAVDVPVGVTTGAWTLPDVRDRLRAVTAWRTQPDFASVNFHEAGAVDLALLLLDRGVGVEPGVWTPTAARTLRDSGLAERSVRILIEPTEPVLADALANVEEILAALDDVAPGGPRLLHGLNATAWDVLDEAARRGYDTRIGLEDTLALPDGRAPEDNAALIRCARARLGGQPAATLPPR